MYWSVSQQTGCGTRFSFSLAGCLTSAKEPSLLYKLHISEQIGTGRADGFIFLMQSETQAAESIIWTRVTNNEF